MKRELILEEWNRYISGAYPRPFPPEVVAHFKAAFFAGATASIAVLQRGMSGDPKGEPSEGDLELLEEVRQELKAFAMGA